MRVDVGGAPRNPPHSYTTATTTILGPAQTMSQPCATGDAINHLALHGAPLTLARHPRMHKGKTCGHRMPCPRTNKDT